MLSRSSDVGVIDSQFFTTGQVLCISLHWPSGRVLSGEAEVEWNRVSDRNSTAKIGAVSLLFLYNFDQFNHQK